MNQKNLSKWLQCIIIIMGLCGFVVCAAVIPLYGKHLQTLYPEFSNRFLPWLIFLWLSSIPCFTVLVFAWKIATNIGNDQSFSTQNARLLQWISSLSTVDAGFFFVGNILLLLLDMSHPSLVIASLLVVFIGIVFAVVTAILSHLVQKAAVLQEQSDWTV